MEELHFGRLDWGSEDSAPNWALLAFDRGSSVEVVTPIDAFEYYTFVEDGDEMEEVKDGDGVVF